MAFGGSATTPSFLGSTGSVVKRSPNEFTSSPIGSLIQGEGGTELYDPSTGKSRRTGQQIGTDVGQMLRALQESSGLNLLGSSSGSGAGAGGAGGGAGASAPHVSLPDTGQARAAAFGRAKDLAGQNAQAAIRSLREQMAGRGLLGSGLETAGTGEIIGRTAQGLTDVGRDQALKDVDASTELAKMGYQGDITQRGQDLEAQMARERLAQAYQQNAMEGLLSVLGNVKAIY